MINGTLLVTMGKIAIATAVIDMVCVAFGRNDIARFVTIAGVSAVAGTTIKMAVDVVNTVSTLFK